MTRKDYTIIAGALAQAYEAREDNTPAREGVLAAMGFMAIELAKDNEQFDAKRFIAACIKERADK